MRIHLLVDLGNFRQPTRATPQLTSDCLTVQVAVCNKLAMLLLGECQWKKTNVKASAAGTAKVLKSRASLCCSKPYGKLLRTPRKMSAIRQPFKLNQNTGACKHCANAQNSRESCFQQGHAPYSLSRQGKCHHVKPETHSIQLVV